MLSNSNIYVRDNYVPIFKKIESWTLLLKDLSSEG